MVSFPPRKCIPNEVHVIVHASTDVRLCLLWGGTGGTARAGTPAYYKHSVPVCYGEGQEGWGQGRRRQTAVDVNHNNNRDFFGSL